MFCFSDDMMLTAKAGLMEKIASDIAIIKTEKTLDPYSGFNGFLLVSANQSIPKTIAQRIIIYSMLILKYLPFLEYMRKSLIRIAFNMRRLQCAKARIKANFRKVYHHQYYQRFWNPPTFS